MHSLDTLKEKTTALLKSHFDKNPNDLIVVGFAVVVLAFILIFTPQIPESAAISNNSDTGIEKKLPADDPIHDRQNHNKDIVTVRIN